jgi:hypothetical protein
VALGYHLLTPIIRADELTTIGFLERHLEESDELLASSLARWPKDACPYSIHVGFSSLVEGREFVPLGSRRRLEVREPIPRLGHFQSPPPYVVFATRTIRDAATTQFSRAFAIPIVSESLVFPGESGNEILVASTCARVLAERTWGACDRSLAKALFGRGMLTARARVAIDDADRLDLLIRFCGVEIDEETMGYTDHGYRGPKLELVRNRAAERPIIVVDLSDVRSEHERAAAMRELEFLLRRTFVRIRRNGHIPPGVLGVVPRKSWFARQLTT